MAWLDQLLDMTKEAESPRSFFFWSGLAAIAGVLKRNVWIDRFMYKLYPNLFILLVAKSGGRKGLPIALASSLVSAVDNTKVISGRNSIQGIVKELSTIRTKEGGGMQVGAQAFLVSAEFSTLVIDDPISLTILTDLYDCPDMWKNTLKLSGVETLKNVGLTVLGAMNQTHFKDRISAIDITGGFIGRTLIVLEDSKGKKNSLVRKPDTNVGIKEVVDGLKEIAKLSGAFEYTDEAADFYDDWYMNEHDPSAYEDHTGTADRIHDTILKVAILLAASELRGDMKIHAEDIQKSVRMCLSLIPNVKRVTIGKSTGKAEISIPTQLILSELINADSDGIERSRLLRKYYGEFDAFVLDRVIDSLTQSKAVDINRKKGQTYYQMKPEIIAQYKQFKESRT